MVTTRSIQSRIACLDPNPTSPRPVLLLHGLGADSESWFFQFPVLVEAGFRPLAVDLPGFGRSPAPDGQRWSLRFVAQEMIGLLDEVGCPQADVVGLSMGGVVAQQLALDWPERVRRLVLVSTFACLRPRRPGELAYLLGRFLRANLRGVHAQAEMVAWRIFPAAEQGEYRRLLVEKILQADPACYKAATRALALFDSRRRLAHLRIPTLVVTGAEDTTVSPASQAKLAQLIPGARQVVIPGGNHGVSADQPEPFNQALIAFLSEG
jgi:3-oxoadipate enol-lactonase